MKKGFYGKKAALIALLSLAFAMVSCSGADRPSSTSSSAVETTYAITWKNYDGFILETDERVPSGSIPTYDGATPTRPDDETYRYVWTGWSPQVSPAAGNRIYTATFSSERLRPEYTVTFDLSGGASASIQSPQTVEAFEDIEFFFDCQKEGLNFRGWSYQGRKVYDEKGTLLFTPSMAKSMTFTALYAETPRMNIEVNMPEAGTVVGAGEYAYNSYVNLSAKPREGYLFDGWYYQGVPLSNSEDYRYMMWNKDVTLEARFKFDSFLMSVKANNPECGLVSIQSLIGASFLPTYEEYHGYTTEVTVVAYSKTDERFLGWYDEDGALVATNASYAFNMPCRDYSLEAKWALNALDVMSSDETKGTVSITQGKGYTGEQITLKAAPASGCVFKGWYEGEERVSKDRQYTFTMPNHNRSLKALFWTTEENRGMVPVLSEDGKTLTYGLYPKKVVSDPSLIAELNALKAPESSGWYLLDNDYYFKDTTNPNWSNPPFWDGTPCESGAEYWFTVEPISWKILSAENGDFFLLSEQILDIQRFNEYYAGTDSSGNYASNYAASEIRAWLNKDFLAKAFYYNSSIIKTTEVDNSKESTGDVGNPYACQTTSDKVFLLSFVEATNADYGFGSNADRICSVTDYAIAKGAFVHEKYNSGDWWLRSPSPTSDIGAHVSTPYGDGALNGGYSTNFPSVGARPALHISLD